MPIRTRCLLASVVAALSLVAAWAPAASADVTQAPVELMASPAEANATAGGVALFHVSAVNNGLIARDARLVAQETLPVGWSYNFTPAVVSLPAQGSNNTTLALYVPADAQANTTVTFAFKAVDAGTGFDLSAVRRVNVTVLPPPLAPEPSEPQPPALGRSVTTGDSGQSGETVQGQLTLLNQDSRELRVSIALEGSSLWNPRLRIEDEFRVLPTGSAPLSIPLFVDVPDLARNTTQEFLVTLQVEGWNEPFLLTWSVLGITPAPAPAAESGGSSTTNQTSDAGDGSSHTPVATPPPPGLALRVFPVILDIASGEESTATVTIENTGGVALAVRLEASISGQWPVLFEASAFDLAPQESRDITMTIRAPEGIPTGGTGAGNVVARTDQGLVRNTDFSLRIVPSTIPRDETPAATIEPPATADTATTAIPGGMLVAAGLGAAGAGALVIARRPWREKLIWAAAGLYTRLAKPDVLNHEERDRLYRLIEQEPGVHFHALQRTLGWNTGTLTYHLRVLEKHGFVVDRRDGLYRRFYLQGAAPRKETFEGPSGLRADVLEAVRNQHGISQSDLALALGANKQTVNYHVKTLERQGLLRIEKRGRDTFLYPAATAARGPGYGEA